MAKIKHFKIALEAIEFQSGAFFKELTLVLKSAFDKGTTPNLNEQKDLGAHLDKVIFQHTGVKSKVTFTLFGTGVYIPDVTNNSILTNMYGPFFKGADGKKMIENSDELGKSVGLLDLVKSRVSGDFSKYEIPIEIDLSDFTIHKFTAEESAAILLHELGHWFTYCEMLDRVVKGNMLLGGLCSTLSGTDFKEKEIAIKMAGDVIGMSKDEINSLQKNTSDKVITTVFITKVWALMKTKEGHTFYDMNTWEMLADQFAARHGAGRYLTTALDKLYVIYGAQQRGHFIYYMSQITSALKITLRLVATALGFIASPFFGVLLAIVSVIFTINAITTAYQTDDAPIYDKPKDRFLRVRRQLIERLKNTELSPEIKISITGDIKHIDEILTNYEERAAWLEVVDNFLFKSSRARRDNIEFQKDLEKLAMNDLFISAASLSTN